MWLGGHSQRFGRVVVQCGQRLSLLCLPAVLSAHNPPYLVAVVTAPSLILPPLPLVQGNITVGDVAMMLPFNDYLYILAMTGQV